MTATLHLVHSVICDDVRIEIFSKETIVGVYTGGLVVPSLPWAANLCLWMSVIWSGDGDLPIEIRVLNPRQQQIAEQKATGTAKLQGIESTVTFRGMFFVIDMEGVYTFQSKAGTQDWQIIKQLPVYVLRETTSS